MKTYIFTFRLLKNDKIVEVDHSFNTEDEVKSYIEIMERTANALCIDFREI